jgi:hypothetical protein
VPISTYLTRVRHSILTPLGARVALLGLSAVVVALGRPPPSPPPPATVLFVYSSDAQDLVAPLIAEFDRTHPDVHVRGLALASGEAEQRIAGVAGKNLRAAAWMPATSLWFGVLNSDTDAHWARSANAHSVVKSPEVLAMWHGVVDREFSNPVSWLTVLRSARTGSRDGHPFKLSLTDVDSSTSGLFAAISIYAAYAGTEPSSLTEATVDHVRPKVRRVELALAHYLPKASDFCEPLSVQGDRFTTAVFIQETTFVKCNAMLRQAGKPPLDGLYPSGGTFVADYPYVVLNAWWVSNREAAAADEFGGWLRSNVARIAATYGYRLPNTFTRPPQGGVPGHPESSNRPPGPELIGHIRGNWRVDRG